MLRSAVAVAAPALGLAWFLAQADVAQRASVASAIQSLIGRGSTEVTAAASPQPQMMMMPAVRAPVQASTNADTFAIDMNSHGQYETRMIVAGRELPVLVDTGAYSVFLSFEDAASIGIHPRDAEFTLSILTANGKTRAAPATLASVRVGNVEARNVPAVVSMPGALTTRNLLGMTFLNRLSGFEIQSGRLVLKQ